MCEMGGWHGGDSAAGVGLGGSLSNHDLGKMVLSHITIGAVGTWFGRWTVLAGMSKASAPTTVSTTGWCRFRCQLIDLLFEVRVGRVHNG